MLTVKEKKAIDYAISILEKRMLSGPQISNADSVKKFMFLKLNDKEREQFDVMFLNTQNVLIEHSTMFMGTIDQSPVFPREIVKKALELNARSIILAHNHPSGISAPSLADKSITAAIVAACDLFSITVMDHIIVGNDSYSFAEHGLI
jgi:DNA repair protein RadC